MASEQSHYTKRTFTFRLHQQYSSFLVRRKRLHSNIHYTKPRNLFKIAKQLEQSSSSIIEQPTANIFLSSRINIKTYNNEYNTRKWSKQKTKIQKDLLQKNQKTKMFTTSPNRRIETEMFSSKMFVTRFGAVDHKERISFCRSISSTNQISKQKSKWFQKHRWKVDGKFRINNKINTCNVNKTNAFYIKTRKVNNKTKSKRRTFFEYEKSSKIGEKTENFKTTTTTTTTTGEKFSKILCKTFNDKTFNNNNNEKCSFKFFTHNSNIDKNFSYTNINNNTRKLFANKRHDKTDPTDDRDDIKLLCSKNHKQICYKCDNAKYANTDETCRCRRVVEKTQEKMEIFKFINNKIRSISKMFKTNYTNRNKRNGTIKFFNKTHESRNEQLRRCSESEKCYKFTRASKSSSSSISLPSDVWSTESFANDKPSTIASQSTASSGLSCATLLCSTSSSVLSSLSSSSLSSASTVFWRFWGRVFKIFFQNLLPILLLFNTLPFIKAGE